MVFTFETRYDTKALSVMARALRKTVRKKRSRRSHILGWIVIVFALLLLLADGFALDAYTIITSLAMLSLLLVLLFEDRLNGAVAKKRLLPGTEKAVTVFSEDKFVSTTDVGKTEWNYDKILAVAETADFFVFIFSKNHGQVYDKRSLQGGTADDFRRFIEAAAGKPVQRIA